VTSVAWARAKPDAGPRPDGEASTAGASRVNALATTGSDCRVCVWLP
jgi:hypothetical protein